MHDKEELEMTSTTNTAADQVAILRTALRTIEKWHGQFPSTGETWPDGTPTSYAAEFGSNGERDYMRQLAHTALKDAERAATQPAGDAVAIEEKWCIYYDNLGENSYTNNFMRPWMFFDSETEAQAYINKPMSSMPLKHYTARKVLICLPPAAPAEPVQAVAAPTDLAKAAQDYLDSVNECAHATLEFSTAAAHTHYDRVRSRLQKALAAAPAPAPSAPSGPRFTGERPDILNAMYAGFRRGDSVERVHFDVVELLKASAPAEAVSVRDDSKERIKPENPYYGSGLPAENWQRGYNGERFIGYPDSPAEQFYKEGVAARRALQSTPEAQAGESLLDWQFVPTRATEDMHAAAVRTIVRCNGNDEFPPKVYAAMLAAAPAPPLCQHIPKKDRGGPNDDEVTRCEKCGAYLKE